MDLVARKKLNLDVLKKHDPNICDILDQSAHAVVYKFDTEKQSWEKLGYEGVIFLTQGKNAPYFGLYVLNRLSIENFSLHLTDFEEINLTDEFIIYQTSEGEACALWLFEEKDRERILAKVLKLNEGIKSLPSTQKQAKPVESKLDILQMLQQATVSPAQETKRSPSLTPSTQKQPEPVASKLDLLQMLKQAERPPAQETKHNPSSNSSVQKQPELMGTKLDLLQMLKQAERPPAQETNPNPSLKSFGNDFINVPQQQHLIPNQMLMHNMPIPMPEKTEGNVIQDMLISANNNNDNDKNMLMNVLNNNMNNLNMNKDMPPRKTIANGELTKPFYPPFMNMSPAASPANSLLQALHGGLPAPPPPPPPMAMPLLPQQVMGMMRPEVNRRFAGRPMLSKPEFIQQLLNMIQCDPTFFDVLYESYQDQMVHAPPPPSAF